jgi:hypothetical protein
MNSLNITDNFLINDIAIKNYYEYGKFDEKLVIGDMRQIFVFTHDLYLFYVKPVCLERVLKIKIKLDHLKNCEYYFFLHFYLCVINIIFLFYFFYLSKMSSNIKFNFTGILN